MTPSALLRASRDSFAAGGLSLAWRLIHPTYQSRVSPKPGPFTRPLASLAADGGDDANGPGIQQRTLCANQQSPGPVTHPAVIIRSLFEGLPPYPTPSTLRHVRQRLDEAGLGASSTQVLGPAKHHRAARDAATLSGVADDADAILAAVTALMQRHASHPRDRFWARSSLPELLLLLARLRIPSHPKLEVALVLLLRRGKLPTPSHEAWQDPALSPCTDRGTLRRRQGSRVEMPSKPPLPTALRLAQAMAAVPVLSHEAWQQLAERHILAKSALTSSPPSLVATAPASLSPLLDSASPDQLTVVAAAFARAGYHPVELFGAIADRLLPVVSQLQPSSLARALHAFAAVRHHDPTLAAALCEEVHLRMGGGGGSDSGSVSGVGGLAAAGGSSGVSYSVSGPTGGLLSLAGAALFGRGRSGGPDRAHRPPPFLLEDLARLAAAAVHLGAGEAALGRRGYGMGEGGGSGSGGGGLGSRLLAVVAEEAEEMIVQQVRRVVDAAGLAAEPPVGSAAGEQQLQEQQLQEQQLQEQQPRGDHQLQEPRARWQLLRHRAELSKAVPVVAVPGMGSVGLEPLRGDLRGQPEGSGGGNRWGGADEGIIVTVEGEGEHGEGDDGDDADDDGIAGGPASAHGESMWPAGWPSGGLHSGARGGCGNSAWLSEQLEPVMGLLGALTVGGAADAFSPAARAAYVVASKYLVPELPVLAPRLATHHLVTMLVALLPGAAASLRRAAHPYPNPQPPPPRHRIGSSSVQRRALADSVGEMLAAVAATLSRRIDTGVSRDARSLFEAWHALASARAMGVPGADDPRVTAELMPAVFAAAVRHGPHLGSPAEAVRFVVSCALLSAFDRSALDAVTTPLVAAMRGGTDAAAAFGSARNVAQQQQQQRLVAPNAGGGSSGNGNGGGGGGGSVQQDGAVEPAVLSAAGLAQLAWGLGHLGYDNEELLAALQRRALALSAAPASALGSTDGGGGDQLGQGRGRGRASAGVGSTRGGCGASLLGPLELADVMWGLAVNEVRTNRGADIRELYVRAALQGVVSIDDPRWLRLVRVHVLLLLGWAGGLGETTAGQLQGSWFNALAYAWERQAVDRGEQLAGPTGLPPDPDAATTAFRQGVAAAAREWARSGGADSDGGGAAGGRWRLQTSYTWGMMQPSSDVRLTVPLLARRQGGPGEAPVSGLRRRSWGGMGAAEWLVALDLVRRADEAEVVSGGEVAAWAGMWPQQAAAQNAPPSSEEAPDSVGELKTARGPEVQDAYAQGWQRRVSGKGNGLGAALELRQGRGALQPLGGPEARVAVPSSGAHLLGPARWRRLVLRLLGVTVRPIRQQEWERAGARERRSMLQQALRV